MENENNEWHGSICQVLESDKNIDPHTNKPRSFLLRFADFTVNQESPLFLIGSRTYYSRNNDSQTKFEAPSLLLLKNKNRNDNSANKIVTCVWNGFVSDKTTKIDESPEIVDIPWYEIVEFGTSVGNKDLSNVMDELIKGVRIKNNNYKYPFLLQINNSSKELICLEISKDNSTIDNFDEKQINLKLIEGGSINIYKIDPSDVISSKYSFSCLSYFQQDEYKKYFTPRKIYRKSSITSPITITIMPFIKMISQFLEYSIKSLSTFNELKPFIHELRDAVEGNGSNFEKYLKTLNYGEISDVIKSYVDKYIDYKYFIEDYKKREDSWNKIIAYAIESIPQLREKYTDILLSNYLLDEKTERETSISNLDKDIEEKKGIITDITDDLNALKSERESIKDEIGELITKKENIKQTLLSGTDSFFNNLSALRDLLGVNYPGNQFNYVDNHPYKITKRTIQKAEITSPSEENKSFEDISLHLVDNLSESGLDKRISEMWAKIITISYLYHIPLLCSGGHLQDLVNAISVSITGCQASTICIPTGFNDYYELLKTIKESKSDIIVIENIISTMDDYFYIHLQDDVPEKYIIFAENFTANLKLVPPEIYSNEESEYYPIIMKKIQKTLSNVLIGSSLTDIYSGLRAKIFSHLIIDGYDEKKLISLVIPELLGIFKIIGVNDEYIESIDSSSTIGLKLKECLEDI